MYLSPASQIPEDTYGYGGAQRYILNDRPILLYHCPLGAEHLPQADERRIPNAAVQEGARRETPHVGMRFRPAGMAIRAPIPGMRWLIMIAFPPCCSNTSLPFPDATRSRA